MRLPLVTPLPRNSTFPKPSPDPARFTSSLRPAKESPEISGSTEQPQAEREDLQDHPTTLSHPSRPLCSHLLLAQLRTYRNTKLGWEEKPCRSPSFAEKLGFAEGKKCTSPCTWCFPLPGRTGLLLQHIKLELAADSRTLEEHVRSLVLPPITCKMLYGSAGHQGSSKQQVFCRLTRAISAPTKAAAPRQPLHSPAGQQPGAPTQPCLQQELLQK